MRPRNHASARCVTLMDGRCEEVCGVACRVGPCVHRSDRAARCSLWRGLSRRRSARRLAGNAPVTLTLIAAAGLRGWFPRGTSPPSCRPRTTRTSAVRGRRGQFVRVLAPGTTGAGSVVRPLAGITPPGARIQRGLAPRVIPCAQTRYPLNPSCVFTGSAPGSHSTAASAGSKAARLTDSQLVSRPLRQLASGPRFSRPKSASGSRP
jgi:hypothetical protein